MLDDVMYFKVPRVRTIPALMRPPTILAAVMIANQHGSVNSFRYFSVMRRSLSILFQHINAHGQIRATREMSGNRPAKFRAQFPCPPGPLAFIVGNIPEFFAGNFLPEKHP